MNISSVCGCKDLFITSQCVAISYVIFDVSVEEHGVLRYNTHAFPEGFLRYLTITKLQWCIPVLPDNNKATVMHSCITRYNYFCYLPIATLKCPTTTLSVYPGKVSLLFKKLYESFIKI